MTTFARHFRIIALCLTFGFTVGASAQELNVLWSADHGDELGAIAISPDGSLAASGSRYAYGSYAYGMLWDGDDGDPIEMFDNFSIYQDSIVHAAISADNQLLAVGYVYPDFYNGYSRTDVFDIATHTRIGRYGGSSVCFSADGSLVATGGGGFVRTVYVRDVATGDLLEDVYTGDYIWALDIAPDGSFFAAGTDDGTIRLWTIPDATPMPTLTTGTGKSINSVAISPDSSLVAIGTAYEFGGPGTIVIWDAHTGELVQELLGHQKTTRVSFSPDGRKLLSYGNGQIKVWRLMDGALLGTYDLTAYDAHYAADASKIVYHDGNIMYVARAPFGLVGDINCDGVMNFDDIDPFVLALSGQAGYAAQFANCDWYNADVDGDGAVNFADVDAFVALLSAQ